MDSYVRSMGGLLPEQFWSRAAATITTCAFIGALIGLIGGLIVGSIGEGIAIGIGGGSIVSIVLVAWMGERPPA